MSKFQIQKGLFRLWIVLTVLWVSYLSFDVVYISYRSDREKINEMYDKGIAQAPEFVPIPLDDPKIRPATKQTVIELKNTEIEKLNQEYLDKMPKYTLFSVWSAFIFSWLLYPSLDTKRLCALNNQQNYRILTEK